MHRVWKSIHGRIARRWVATRPVGPSVTWNSTFCPMVRKVRQSPKSMIWDRGTGSLDLPLLSAPWCYVTNSFEWSASAQEPPFEPVWTHWGRNRMWKPPIKVVIYMVYETPAGDRITTMSTRCNTLPKTRPIQKQTVRCYNFFTYRNIFVKWNNKNKKM